MASSKQNILFIILDTLRRDRLSVYGHERNTSPELDTFAQQTTLFERAVAPAQWTVPSHASMFTGLYPSTHQLTEANRKLSGSYPTLAEILQVDGYHTVGFCNNPLVGVLDNGLQRGFNEFYNYAGVSPNRPIDVKRSRIQRDIMRRFRKFARNVSNQFAHNDGLFRMSLHPLLTPIWTRMVNYKGSTEQSISDLMDYWRMHHAGGSDEPVFAFLNLMGAHLPYRPPQEYLDRIAPHIRKDKHAYRFMSRFNADAARWASPTDPPMQDWEQEALYSFYDAEIAHQDYHLGRLFKYLRGSGALDDTLVVIAADHGEGHGDHQFFGHGFVVYQELVHVPLMIYHKDHYPQGRTIPTNVSTRRIFHTILEFAGLTPPIDATDPNADVAGLSLARTVHDQEDQEGDMAFAEAFPPHTFLHVLEHRQPSIIERLNLRQVRRGIYSGAHKLALVGQHVEGLFDVSHDPAELWDLAEANPSLVTTLQKHIKGFVSSAEARRAEAGLYGSVSKDIADNLRDLGYID